MFRNKKTTLLLVLAVVLALIVEVANADFTFGEPTNLGAMVNSSSADFSPSISADGLIFIFQSNRPGGYGRADLYVTTRETTSEPWGEPVNLGSPINSPQIDLSPSFSPDACTLYYGSYRPGGYGPCDIWVSTRATTDDAWDESVNLGPTINHSGYDATPFISEDGLELYFNSLSRPGGYGGDDIWVSTRETKEDEWGTPVNLGLPVNSAHEEVWPTLSADGLLLFFSSGVWVPDRNGGLGESDIWMTRRKSRDADWGEPVNLGSPVNSPDHEFTPVLSADGSTLYFASNRSGGYHDLWQASIEPIVDFNSDLKVDLADMHILVDHWGQNYSLCDIGPMPWGDGIVDIQDLNVLAKHLYRLNAHWEFDETEGSIAYDSFGDYDGTINGNPFWQPTEGIIGGALLLDGIDDYVSTPFILDPSKGSFSVFAWIYCWTPGQAMVSQTGDFGETWLGINTSGDLITEFCDVYFDPLESGTIITDIQWHHVGLVYDLDTFHRQLYVDGILAAEDTTTVAGNPSDGGFYIGASKDLDSGTFFSGMIDDVRIYNQALSP